MSGRRRGSRSKGRASHTIRRGILLGCFFAAGSLILARAAQLQIVEHDRWTAAAEEQHRERVELPARRGAIFDRHGVPLALSHEMYRVSVAPGELRDPEIVATALAEGLEVAPAEAQRIVTSDDPWVVLRGRFTAEQRKKVGALRGVYFERQFERFYPQGDVAREVIGAVTADNRALGGIEQQLDEVLRGEPGYTVLRRNAAGDAVPALSLPVVPPRDGASVYLTIDLDLQEIADAALRDAMAATGAAGGDLVLADPHTGELLAAVSRRGGRTRSLAAITEPYEPGSTLKPFLVATLLAEGSASLSDTVFAENGAWLDGSRTFRDTSPHGWLSLREALEVSSNIAMAKFAQRLSPGQQYAYLRDFGFGTLTGIEYPAESSGRLRQPREWSRLSSGSLAIGYEISVTPLQLVAAYGALANGGKLMEPYLVREIRRSDGRVLGRRTSVEIRRVVPEEVARAVADVLVAVVAEGTATRAALTTFAVAGKTGTSRRTSGGGYASGSYTATFAGFFPADDPQIVIFVKLDEPQGDYYGGLTAAPVTRETLQGILATRNPGLDPRTLLATRAEAATDGLGGSGIQSIPAGDEGSPTYVFLLGQGKSGEIAATSETSVAVPAVAGLSMREAARRVHSTGLRVRVAGAGSVREVEPAPGTHIPRGETVTLFGERG